LLDQASPQVGVIQIERQADEKLHVHLYQQISDKAFQKIKKSEKKGGNDRRGKGVALH